MKKKKFPFKGFCDICHRYYTNDPDDIIGFPSCTHTNIERWIDDFPEPLRSKLLLFATKQRIKT